MVEPPAENAKEVVLGDPIIVTGEDGQSFDGQIHTKMLVRSAKQNCAANFETHQYLASLFSVEIDTSGGTDTTNGVTVRPAGTSQTEPANSVETMDVTSEEPAQAVNSPLTKPASGKFKFARRTRSAFHAENN